MKLKRIYTRQENITLIFSPCTTLFRISMLFLRCIVFNQNVRQITRISRFILTCRVCEFPGFCSQNRISYRHAETLVLCFYKRNFTFASRRRAGSFWTSRLMFSIIAWIHGETHVIRRREIRPTSIVKRSISVDASCGVGKRDEKMKHRSMNGITKERERYKDSGRNVGGFFARISAGSRVIREKSVAF